MKKIWQFSALVLVTASNSLFSQEEEQEKKVKLEFSGYIETYYSYHFNQPKSEQANSFLYNYNRHNEFNVNIGLIRTKAEYENFYASIALQAGAYVDDNYASEEIQLFNEAFIGVHLDEKTNLEVGILPSSIGFETAVSASNLTLTRSILAENSPYFMTGIKLSHQFTDKFSLAGIVSNGWQRINKPNRDALPSFGTQMVYQPNDKSTLNWSTFIGDEPVGETLRTRYFSNLYYDCQWNAKWRTIVGFDYGMQKSDTESDFNNWFSPILITQYTINPKWQTALRTEYYQDKNGVIVSSDSGFKTFGASINLDFLPNEKVKFRTEARYLNSEEPFFEKNDGFVNDNFMITASLSFEF